MSGLINKLSNIRSPVAGAVICIVVATLASIIITSIVALAFGDPTTETKIILSNVISMGSSLLFGGFMLLSRGYSSVSQVKYYPVKSSDFGVNDL